MARLVAAGAVILAVQSPAATAQEGTAKPRWTPTVVLTTSYGDHTGGSAGSQAVTVYLNRPNTYWTFSAGHQRLLGDEGYGFGIGFHRAWRQRYRIGLGMSSGANRRGGLYPRYHVGFSAGMNLTDPLQVSIDYGRRRSAVDAAHSDRIGAGFTWYAPGPWILGGGVIYGMNQPGSRTAWSGGGGLTYSVWERWSVGVRLDYGDGSYMLLPSQGVVEFESWAYSASVSKYVAPKLSFRLTAGHTDYYGGFNLSLAMAKGW
jgi:YaiO family outer membrane protein